MKAESTDELRQSPLVEKLKSWQTNVVNFLRRLKAFKCSTVSLRYVIVHRDQQLNLVCLLHCTSV